MLQHHCIEDEVWFTCDLTCVFKPTELLSESFLIRDGEFDVFLNGFEQVCAAALQKLESD